MLTALYWLLLVLAFIPMLTLLGVVWILRGIRSLAQERPPVSEKLLRSPGESLRRELEKIDEQINDIVILTTFGPALFVAIFIVVSGTAKPAGWSIGSAIVFVVVSIG